MPQLPSRLLVAALLCGCLSTANSADPPKPPADEAEAMRIMLEFGKTGPEHERLAKFAGEWNVVSKNFEGDPANPTTSEGTSTSELILGGRFLRQIFKGDWNGVPFEGRGVTGYDKTQKKYVGVWIDNFGTGIMHISGDYDPKTKTLTETGESSSPFGPMKFKLVTQEKSDDEHVFTMFTVDAEGKETKMSEMTYTRKK